MHIKSPIILISLVLAFLSSCSTAPDIKKPISTTTFPAVEKPIFSDKKKTESIKLIEQGDIFKGIKLFENSILNANEQQKNKAYLQISEALFDNEYYQLSERYFEKTSKPLLNVADKGHYQVLLAGLLLLDNAPIKTLNLINNTPTLNNFSYTKRKLLIQIQAYNQINRPIEEVKTRVSLNAILQKNSKLKKQNELKIWGIFSTLPLNDLLIETNNKISDYQAWLQYSLITRQKHANKFAYDQNIQNWFIENKDHASILFILKIDELFSERQRPPKEIAVLLPVTGKYQAISNAILEGVFTQYYEHIQENPNQLINITIYNTANAKDSIWPIYNLAKKSKPGIILGPLQKAYVEQLLESSSLPVPVLTFNYSSVERLDSNQFDLIEFGLRPEDEAVQIANLSATKDLLKSIAIIPRSNFGQRMLKTYRNRLEHHGGEVINHEAYSRTQKDFSRSIKQLVGINKSQNRYRRLKNITGEKFEFEPRIRQDVDNVFVVANNKQGKLIIPQLKFFQVGKLPVFANSQIFKPNQKNDSDLNNVIFLAPPWSFDSLSSESKRHKKFIALGNDSFSILSHLTQFKQNPDFTFKGKIGLITMDNNGRLHREQEWATIKYGKMEKITPVFNAQTSNR